MTATISRLMLVAACLFVMPTFVGVEIAVAQSSLKKCPKSQNVRWHNCFGTYTAENGEKYVGEFKDDKYNGQGTATYPSGDKYVGEFKDNKRHGQGTYTYKDGQIDVGEFRDGKLNGQATQTSPDGNKYVGEFKDDKRDGQFTVTYANGDKYVGEFKDNKRHGQGTLTLASGAGYIGEFEDGNFNGRGTFTYPSGDKYVGELKDNKFNGQVSVLYISGDNFVGTYVSEKRSGHGSYSWKDGSNYRGQWKDGLPTYDGVLTNSSGAAITGAQYKSAAVYDADGYMTSPDVLTYSGGTVQQQVAQTTTEQPVEQPQSIAASNNLRKVALVIGNSGYQHATPLENPHNDAEAMTSLLKNIGFDVVSGTDLDKRATEQKIADFVDRAAQADVSLFFYAGHGIQVAGENFIVPVDAKVEKASAIDFELVNVSMVTSYMGGEKSIGIALLDACRDNPFTRSLSRALGNRSNQVNTGLAELKSAGGGLLVGFATAPGDVAADGVGMKNSPFTTALLKHLATKGLEVELMMKRVKADVYDTTKGEQQPWHNSALRTEVYLAGQ